VEAQLLHLACLGDGSPLCPESAAPLLPVISSEKKWLTPFFSGAFIKTTCVMAWTIAVTTLTKGIVQRLHAATEIECWK